MKGGKMDFEKLYIEGAWVPSASDKPEFPVEC